MPGSASSGIHSCSILHLESDVGSYRRTAPVGFKINVPW